MKIFQAIPLVVDLLLANEKVLLTGAPGVGKSDVAKTVAQLLGANLLVTKPVVKEPTDYRGIPWPNPETGRADFLPVGDIASLLDCTEPTVWFVDDIGQGTDAVQGALMEVIHEGQIEGHRIPDCVYILSATNRASDQAGVKTVLEPLKARFSTIIEIEPDVASWTSWAIENEMPDELIGFLNYRSDLLAAFKPTRNLTNSPMPRTWASLGRIYKNMIPKWQARNIPANNIQEVLAGAVGEGAANEFLAYCRDWKDMPSVNEVLLNPDHVKFPDSLSKVHALCSALTMVADVGNFDAICRFAKRLRSESVYAEFAEYLISISTYRKPELKELGCYAEVMLNSSACV